MTKEEAIKIIEECKEKGFKHTFYTVNEYYAALDMAINALRREDTFFDNVFEIIDKEAEKLQLGGYGKAVGTFYCEEIKRAVFALKGERGEMDK